MRGADEVLQEYSVKERTGRKKKVIIKWFLTKPDRRFDTSEVNAALGDKLNIGEGQIRNYLEDLTEENVLQSYGGQRKAYQLNGDILIPTKYRLQAVLKHLSATFDPDRWGYSTVIILSTIIWGLLTLPFWLLWATLLVFPASTYGSINQAEFFTLATAMTFWFVVLGLASYVLYSVDKWGSS
ncbi:hypothetical protein [Halorubrum sp. Hd13]|uniref:hypothetical protein n=1 Tax=Halorubrum sp. Hd13 TaxID=1480728 RepID=UPI0011404D65|nr:hypothetical protein [Halorubrum sp. Hd13]